MRTPHTALLRLVATLTVIVLAVTAGPVSPASAAGGPNLAAGRPAAASASNGPYTPGNVNDGNQSTYWEGPNNAFPQWVRVDLGASTSVDQVVVKLPPSWEARTQTFAVQGSADGTSYTTLAGSAAHAFSPGAGNTVTVNFPAAEARYVRLNVTANTGWPAAQVAELEVYGATGSSGNLAQGRPMTASGSTQTYAAANAGDGNQSTYWESANNAFPQWLQVDLGSAVRVNRLVLKIPAGWEARTQTLEVQGSTDGSSFSTVVAPAAHRFEPAATITFNAVTTRHLRLRFTANTAWPAAQIAEFEVYGAATGDTQAPTAPGDLAYTEPSPGQIRLTWNASTDNTGVTAYDVYANDVLRTSVAGNVLTYTDTQPANATVTYHVKARDAAGNQSAAGNAVTRRGDTGDTQAPTAPGDLAYTEPSPGQIRLTWNASTDNTGVTGYDVYANDVLRTSVAGNVLTYTDTQPANATVTYRVRAKDAAGNQSAASNAVTRTGSGGGSNLAVGKPISASSHVHTFVAANANDNSTATYWEAAPGAYPNTLTVRLGANASITSVVVKLNPDAVWGARTQTIEVLGREQSASAFTTLKAAAPYAFDPAGGNTVTIPVTADAADVQLKITSNTGSSGGQVAELQVIGTPAPNPDLQVTALTWTPSSPVETDTIRLQATVRNSGTRASGATDVNFYLGGTKVGTAPVASLSAGASANVSADVGARNAGSYPVTAEVDEANAVIEQNDLNNELTASSPMTVRPVDSSDLVASPVSWTPGNPANGTAVTFSVAIKNQGNVASASGAHGITLTVLDDAGTVVRTLTGSHNGVIAAGATTAPVNLGTWTAANGRYTVRTELAADAAELPVKRGDNVSTVPLFVGRGANMPYDMYEAEDGSLGGGAQVVGPNRTVGDLAGEASGRKAVTLNTTGSYVEFTTKAPTNTLVTRFSIPDAPGGGGTNSTLNVYVNGSFHKAISLTSRYAWLYGNETNPGNSPGSGGPRHIYDEANMMLNTTVPAGSRIRLQKDAANTTTYAIDFVNTEQVAPVANPDPARYVTPTGFAHQDVQNALDRARMESGWLGVYLPPGDYQTSNKFQVYGKPVKIVGAGPWYTRFHAPATQDNTDVGFRAEASANGSTFAGFAYFGNYTSRIDGPGKVFDFGNVADITIDDIWAEHMVCLYWGANTDRMTIKNSRIRNTFADAINMTNGSTDNLVSNNESRASGDDSFALFSAIDAGGGDVKGNVYENLTSILTWRAAGVAVYGGYDNVFRNIHIADTLVYSGITISSLDFGYPMNGFGADPPTRFDNISIVRAGGHFWGSQTFPGIWVFSASKVFQGIRVSNVDIVDPTYHGIMFQTNYVGGQPQNPVKDTVFTNVSITGARKSGDAYDAKSGFGIWANEMPEAGQGPAVGSAVFNNLRMSGNAQDVRNTTSTFTITVND
ncbi:discoidin domain-containing protein [Planobispora siamensis]|uniref:Glycosyl hydrolase n=1 Tax=Planobispora siamensis TaxID=936338 RepID=A0A8J3SKW1_9ACTN|nr:discoidin domain-containing protein [Planobispora siamensis]GIH94209.1 glycosyl hydrolase [Planobispora siamensis]